MSRSKSRRIRSRLALICSAGPALGALLFFSGCIFAPAVSPEVLDRGQYCAGFGLQGVAVSGPTKRFSWSTIYGRAGLGSGWEFGFEYAVPRGFYLDAKRQLSRWVSDEAMPDPLATTSDWLAAADLCLSADQRVSFPPDSSAEPVVCWVVGAAPSIVAGTANLYGGAQVLLQAELLSPRPSYRVFPGLVGGATFVAQEYPFRVVPSLSLFIDPGLNRRPVQLMVAAGVAIQVDFDRFSQN